MGGLSADKTLVETVELPIILGFSPVSFTQSLLLHQEMDIHCSKALLQHLLLTKKKRVKR